MSLKATREWFGEILVELGHQNEKIVVVNCDLGSATHASRFEKAFPDRFFECGIAEANAISISAGLAQEGFRPFLTSFGHFLTGKFLEIFQSVGLNEAGVVLVGTHSGLAIGKDGPTQMGLRDLALMTTLQNMEIYHPVDGCETKQIMQYIANDFSPSYLRLCRQPTPELHTEKYTFNRHQPDVLANGSEIIIFSMGGTVPVLMDCIENFNSLGISACIVNVPSLPVDPESIRELVQEHKYVFVVEDHFVKGGLADEISRIIVNSDIAVKFFSWGVPDYAQAGTPDDLYKLYKLDVAGITENVLSFLSGEKVVCKSR